MSDSTRVVTATVVVATCDRPAMMQSVVESILAAAAIPAELIIVDQSTLAHPAPWSAEGCEVRYVHSTIRSLSRANNLAARLAAHEVLVFTHDDVLVDPDWLEALTDRIDTDRPRTVVTGRVVATDPEVDGGFAPALNISTEPRSYRGRVGYDVLKPMNFAICRAWFEEVGGFDERLGPGTIFPGAEDSDFGFRLLEAGSTLEYVPAAVVRHRAWRDGRAYLPLRWQYGVAQGAFYAKHLTRHDLHMLGRMRDDVRRRAVSFPGRLRRERSRALGDPLFVIGNVVGGARWRRQRRGERRQGRRDASARS